MPTEIMELNITDEEFCIWAENKEELSGWITATLLEEEPETLERLLRKFARKKQLEGLRA